MKSVLLIAAKIGIEYAKQLRKCSLIPVELVQA